MTWLDKFLFLSIGLGSILYFMLGKINEMGIPMDRGMMIILVIIMSLVTLSCVLYLRSEDQKTKQK
ncbi:hypothetical protein EGK58_013370 [Acinetobacter variabilis]|uniref:hypothetical protein n=1 Tax=Acinetobacter TaxID=469 RepID=UPI00044D3858|nr:MULTISPECIES: hypothetical protein [Acinetobacter]EXA67870.1 putative membrane protein [Acinetobacter baumannii 348935]QXR19031.1 hypothetical protein EGK58_013370 [Acinetobacter variabilis]BCT90257.1 hypothetical protein RYU24_26620 [Acinetobacter variabilis]